jgi:drug/metabolite transporter (DMT)-like permease
MHEIAAKRLALLALAGGAVGIGFAPILVRLSETGPSATAFYRVLFALPILWIWLSRETPSSTAPAPRPSRHFWPFALAGVLFAADLALWHWSIELTTVANATLLANTAPIFVTIGAAVLFQEKISRRFVLSLVLAMCGAALLVNASLNVSPRHLLGDGLGVAAALFYAAYMLSVKHLRARFSAAAILGWSGLVSGPCLLVIAYVSGEQLVARTSAGWWVLIGLALISHIGGQALIAYAFGHLKASFTSLGLLLQPVVAVILAWMIFGESLALEQITGGVVVLGAIFLASRR